MANDDFDRQEVERLVQDLARRRASAERQAAENKVHVSRWTNARVLMPAVSRASSRRSFTAGLQLPDWFHTVSWWPPFTIPTLSTTSWNALTVRVFVGLGVLLSLSMPYWPYSRSGIWGFALYLMAAEIVLVTGLWGAKLTWDSRLGTAHCVAISTVFWGLTLIAAETLPRVS